MWAVELKRDWKYLDTTDDVPGAWRGRMPTDLLVNGRLPLFNKEPGYMFFRGNNTAMVLFFKGTKKIPGKLQSIAHCLHLQTNDTI